MAGLLARLNLYPVSVYRDGEVEGARVICSRPYDYLMFVAQTWIDYLFSRGHNKLVICI